MHPAYNLFHYFREVLLNTLNSMWCQLDWC